MGHADRLSALDAAFLDAESPSSPLHVGVIAQFELGPLARPDLGDGAVDFAALRAHIGTISARVPRYRQRLARTPLLGTPVWVDDARFNLDFHVRHERLPAPGDVRQLKRLAGRIFSEPLDRTRPLWEMWIVEGLAGNRFAVIAKVHHAMIDGVGGAGLLAELLRGDPDAKTKLTPVEPARPAPSPLALLGDELRHRGRAMIHAVKSARGARARDVLAGIASFAATALRPTSPTPFNPPAIGRHRRIDWTRLELADLKAIKRRLGGTVNDVALAIVSGALRAALLRRGADPQALHHVRALVPVDVRRADHGALGNRVASYLVTLPVDAIDPLTRFRRLHDTMDKLKRGHEVEGVTVLEDAADAAGVAIVGAIFRAAARLRTFNITVTNVPGPPFPLYLLGARLREIAPMVPLLERQAIAIGLFSYAGAIEIGITADWQLVPDLHDLVLDLEAAHRELAAAAAEHLSGQVVLN